MADELLRDLTLRCNCSDEQRLPCVPCRAVAEIEGLRHANQRLVAILEAGIAESKQARPANGMNVPTQLAQSSDESSTEMVRNTRKRAPIGTIFTNPERLDLVTRLRHIHMEVNDLQDVAEDAADEIERLRDANQRLVAILAEHLPESGEASRG